MDETETYQQTNKNIVHASYFIALQVARTKRGHTIGEILVKSCILESVRLVLGEEESKKMKMLMMKMLIMLQTLQAKDANYAENS